MPPISSYPTVEESVEEHDTCDEYLAKGFLTEKEQQQLAQDEEAYKEYLGEEAKAEKERARAEKEWEEEMKKEEAHNELFRRRHLLVRETLAESASPMLDLVEEDIDLNERNLKQCKRKICDGHYTAAVRVLSSSGVAPYNDDTLQELKAKHPLQVCSILARYTY
ncbi:hypothetical protein Tco_1171690 [Tanacetum coccineum]